MKRICSVLLAVLMLLSLASCTSVVDADPAVFESNGMTITLTEKFKETSQEGYTVCYDSSQVAVFVLKEEFSLAEGFEDMSLADYAQIVYEANSARSPEPVFETDGLTCMEYVFDNEGTTYKYLSTMFKASDAFWIVQFCCKEASYEEYKPYFVDWAKSVSFTDN